MAAHTPLPWVLDHSEPCRGRIYCEDATGSIVASCVDFKWAPRPVAEQDANAALIVRAVNNHSGLMAVVTALAESSQSEATSRLREMAKAALAETEREHVT
ncbi:hypothetical protein RPMA_12260 [Tardiphaga alba]|uniref:Uncharacterized protein n=1 Tax=Tardiphaga alba TaxID=340268 RepID=A0ABX8AAV2_9BRAD|nr:hypothetical protein [Tardiphaga alba]QUS39520.1 hypothetical protein RPMA_12260 [Tardiphaga alba]